MISLHGRIDGAERDDNASLSTAFDAWLGDRLVQDDACAALREVLPGASEEQVLAAVAAILRVIREP